MVLTFLFRNQLSLTLLVIRYITDRLPNSLPCKAILWLFTMLMGRSSSIFLMCLSMIPISLDHR
ncbi:hypothetical protein C3997_03149 [Escherichia coli]|nr:hypothetical protein C3997_03149 [Escherichia coli]